MQTCVIIVAITSIVQASSLQDNACSDTSYNYCNVLNPTMQVHTNNLAECISNCDLFGSFNQCDFLLFYSYGPDKNCELIASGMTPEEYLGACKTSGQPLRDLKGACFANSDGKCSSEACSTCRTCANDPCHGVRASGCSMLTPGLTKNGVKDRDECQLHCTDDHTASHNHTYFTYSTDDSCSCFESGERDCQVQVVPRGVTLEQVEACMRGDSPVPTTTTRPGTTAEPEPTTTPELRTTTAATTTTPTTTAPASCDHGWVENSGFCYWLIQPDSFTALVYSECRVKCSLGGGELASIHSQEEEDFVVELIRNSSDPVNGDRHTTWLGGRRTGGGGWGWEDGTEWDFQKWHRNQPDGEDATVEYCLETQAKTTDGGWLDEDCRKRHNAWNCLCKKAI